MERKQEKDRKILHLVADDIEGEVGDSIATWPSHVESGIGAYQPDSRARPTLQMHSGGRQCVKFNSPGVAEMKWLILENNLYILCGKPGLTVVIVVSDIEASPIDCYASDVNMVFDQGFYWDHGFGGSVRWDGNLVVRSPLAVTTCPVAATLDRTHVLAYEFNFEEKKQRIYLDGKCAGEGAIHVDEFDQSNAFKNTRTHWEGATKTTTYAGPFTIGCKAKNIFREKQTFNGSIAEIQVHEKVFDPKESASMALGLLDKYMGISKVLNRDLGNLDMLHAHITKKFMFGMDR